MRGLFDPSPQLAQVRPKGIEVDGNRPVRRNDIVDSTQGSRRDCFRESDGRIVDRKIDPIRELHEQRGIASRHNPEAVHASARSSF